FSSRRRHTRSDRDWSSDVCSSDLEVSNLIRRNGTGNGEARLSVNVEHPGSALLSREVRGQESHFRRNPVPLKSEARLSVNLHQRSEERRVGKESRSRGGA